MMVELRMDLGKASRQKVLGRIREIREQSIVYEPVMSKMEIYLRTLYVILGYVIKGHEPPHRSVIALTGLFYRVSRSQHFLVDLISYVGKPIILFQFPLASLFM